MKTIKGLIPLKVKSPVSVFLREYGKLPFRLVWSHVLRTYVEEGGKVSPTLRKQIYKSVQAETLCYLDSRYGQLANDLTENYIAGEKPDKSVVWIFWWQGEENAPDIVKRCMASIRRNAGKAKVCVIDAENYQDYVSVPQHIEQKLNDGIISFTHFSDYYRMALLAAHGGVWVDASVYVKSKMPDLVDNMPIYTIRNPGQDEVNISNWEWTVGIIGGWKGNTLFVALEQLLNQYWRDNDYLVDYFLFDYMIRLVVDRCNELQAEITNVPANNSAFMFLQNHLCDSAEDYMHVFYAQSTMFYKVSWKKAYPMKTLGGQETLFARWLLENPDR